MPVRPDQREVADGTDRPILARHSRPGQTGDRRPMRRVGACSPRLRLSLSVTAWMPPPRPGFAPVPVGLVCSRSRIAGPASCGGAFTGAFPAGAGDQGHRGMTSGSYPQQLLPGPRRAVGADKRLAIRSTPLIRFVRKTVSTWSPVTESNRRPSPYHGDALPTELTGPVFTCLTRGCAVTRTNPQAVHTDATGACRLA